MIENKLLIEKLKELDPRFFSPLDISFASFICCSADEENNYPLFLAAALISNASVRRKYTCLDLSEIGDDLSYYFSDLGDFGLQAEEQKTILSGFAIPENWCGELCKLKKAVSVPDNGRADFVPLVLDGSLLYIYRDWKCEKSLAKIFKEWCAKESKVTNSGLRKKVSRISKYFKPENAEEDFQQLAVLTALNRKFTVISGGPGTGKTTVAAALSAILLEENPKTKITLCAPTGKAQARLQESVMNQIAELNCSVSSKELLGKIPVATIHRLLGGRPGTPRFRYNSRHKLVLDVLIVDEASMISQSLMKALFDALPADAKIIMLGDMQQLASVESGMILRDFCIAAKTNDELSSSLVELKENHRFASDRGFGLSATAMSMLPEAPSGKEAERILEIIRNDSSNEVALHDLPLWRKGDFEKHLNSYLQEIIVDFHDNRVPYLSFQEEKSVERAYELFNKFRIICVHRNGLYGAEVINQLTERLLKPSSTRAGQSFYKGKPVIINENSYTMKLFNGDTGIIWTDKDNKLKAFFPDSGGGSFRSVDLNLLPAFSSAYAITVHKAQGSGFQQVLIVTPSEMSPLMTREMIYTALSRAEKRAVFWTNENVLLSALQSITKRHSNLRNCLY